MTDDTNTDNYLARTLRTHGVDEADINRLVSARNTLLANGTLRGTEAMSNESGQIHAAIHNLGENVAAYRDKTNERLDGVCASVQHIEQVLAKAETHGGFGGETAGPAMGMVAASQFQEDPSFAAAAAQTARGMKASNFTARINIDSSIRAALTNDGRGNAGDTSFPTPAERRGVVMPVMRPLRLLAALPHRPTESDAVEFIQLSVSGDAAEQIHEGDAKAELDFEGDLKSASVATIAAWTAASRQVLSDNNAIGQAVDNLITNKVLTRLENQLINGVGGLGKINGLLNQAKLFTPTIGTTPADIIGESLVTQANAGYQPSLVIMNPMDWFKIQLTRKNDTDDEYVFGSPTIPVPPALWNTAIVTTPSVAIGSALKVDTSFTTVLDREQVSVVVSNSHAGFFIRNLVAILAELRAGLEVLDMNAIHKFSLGTVEAGG